MEQQSYISAFEWDSEEHQKFTRSEIQKRQVAKHKIGIVEKIANATYKTPNIIWNFHRNDLSKVIKVKGLGNQWDGNLRCDFFLHPNPGCPSTFAKIPKSINMT